MEEYLTYHKNSTVKLEETYKNICNQLGVEHFGYGRVYKDSRYIFLTNNEKLVSDFVQNIKSSKIHYKSCAGIQKFNGSTYYYAPWPSKPETLSLDVFLQNKYWNGLSILNFEEDYIDIWTISPNLNDQSRKSIYNKDHYRKKCLISIDYFNKQYELFLDKLNISDLPILYNGHEYSVPFENKTNRIEIIKAEMKNLLQCYYPKGISIKSKNGITNITATEILVLSFLAQGYSAKQVASIMNNSPKTIEFHKEHLKLKTGYGIKSDLIKMYNDQIKFLVE
jgi:DNA-binding CsgD family transcriptional regulator